MDENEFIFWCRIRAALRAEREALHRAVARCKEAPADVVVQPDNAGPFVGVGGGIIYGPPTGPHRLSGARITHFIGDGLDETG